MPNINDVPPGQYLPQRTHLLPAAATTLTMTAALHAGGILLLRCTGGLTITPPPATGTFNKYTIIVITTISGGDVLIDAKLAAASDIFAGNCYTGSAGGTPGTFGTATNSNLATFNATTSGGIAGTWIEMIDVKTNVMAIRICNVCSGVAITPFSNH